MSSERIKVSLPKEILELSVADKNKFLSDMYKALGIESENYQDRDVWRDSDDGDVMEELETFSMNKLSKNTMDMMTGVFDLLGLDIPIEAIDVKKAFYTSSENPILIAIDSLYDYSDTGLGFEKVNSIQKSISEGVKFPPIVIGYYYDIQDGKHRVEALKSMGVTHVPCVVGGNDPDLVRTAEGYYRTLWKSWSEAKIKRDNRGRFAKKQDSNVTESHDGKAREASGFLETLDKSKILVSMSDQMYKDIIKDGGITIDHTGKRKIAGVDSGYVFAPSKSTEKRIESDQFTPQSIVDYIKSNIEALQKENHYLGAWVDDGAVYLDVSMVGEPNEETLRLAKEADQLAVFDLKNFETVYTNIVKKAILKGLGIEPKSKKRLISLLSVDDTSEEAFVKRATEAITKFFVVAARCIEKETGDV